MNLFSVVSTRAWAPRGLQHGRGVARGRRDRPAKRRVVRVTPWRHEGDSVRAGINTSPPQLHADGFAAAAAAGAPAQGRAVQYCGALTMARAHELSEESNADELENRTPIEQCFFLVEVVNQAFVTGAYGTRLIKLE